MERPPCHWQIPQGYRSGWEQIRPGRLTERGIDKTIARIFLINNALSLRKSFL
jgi:hypothetical protein